MTALGLTIVQESDRKGDATMWLDIGREGLMSPTSKFTSSTRTYPVPYGPLSNVRIIRAM
jgi:hypothetical protein